LAAVHRVEQLGDVLQSQPEALGATDEAHPRDEVR
jgi:hypothetical protein